MKKKWILPLLILLGMLSFNFEVLGSSPDSDVRITTNSEKEQYTSNLKVNLEVQFFENELYNDKVYLSYHLYDKSNNELLWEGQRVPIKMNDSGVGYVQLTIDLNAQPETQKEDHVVIKFDLVDEKNVYWFSTNHDIKLLTDEVVYINDFIKSIFNTFKLSILNHPIIFTINVIFFLAFFVLFQRIRKSQLFIT